MDTTNVRVCALFWCVLRYAELNIVARVHGVWQTATMADEEAKGHDMAAAAGISFFALQQHADRVDADLLAAVERFVDAPTHKDWCVMARRLFFLDDDVEDADIARWDDLKAWEGTSHAHRWLYNWDDGVAVTIDLRRPMLITSIVRYLSGGSTRLHCNQKAALSMAGSFTGEEIEVFSCLSYSACFRDPLPGGGRTLTFPATTARFVRYYTSRSNVDRSLGGHRRVATNTLA